MNFRTRNLFVAAVIVGILGLLLIGGAMLWAVWYLPLGGLWLCGGM